jgi:WXG100 family type VII secretion target
MTMADDPGTTLFNKAGIDQGAADLAAVAKAMETELDELKTYLDKRMATWDGPARSAYQQAQGVWDSAFTKMQTVMTHASTTVQDVGSRYDATERQNAGMWG